MRPLLIALLATLVVLAAACGSDDDDKGDNTSADGPSASATRTETPDPQPSSRPPTAPTNDAGSAIDTADPNAPLYIALGDSLSAGVGASEPEATAFVPLVHAGLGGNVGLLNLGHSGDDSFELVEHGHLDDAVEIIEERNGDDTPGNDVVLVTLEIGGNDLLDLYFSLVLPGTCPNIQEGLQKPVCVNAVRESMDAYAPNLREILSSLQEADPDLPIVLLTLYNPFSGSAINAFEPIGELALEGTPGTPFPEGLNDIMRAEAAVAGVTLADVYPSFVGKAPEYVAFDLIHPDDDGHRVMADIVLAAIAG
jgi:lysophospholipase L1-like esterase